MSKSVATKDMKHCEEVPRRSKTSEMAEKFEELLCKTDHTQTDVNVDLIETLLHNRLADAHYQVTLGEREHDIATENKITPFTRWLTLKV